MIYRMPAAIPCIVIGLLFVLDSYHAKDANCINANETIWYVATCPENKTSDSFIERSDRKNCSQYQSCNGKPLYYHCVRYKGRLVEVCSERTQISGKCCSIFEDGLGRVAEDNTKPCHKCDFHYFSDELVSECLTPAMITTETLSTLSNETTKRTNETTEMTNSSGSSTAKQQDHFSTLTTVLIVVGVLVALVLFFVCICMCIKRNKGNKKHYLKCSLRQGKIGLFD